MGGRPARKGFGAGQGAGGAGKAARSRSRGVLRNRRADLGRFRCLRRDAGGGSGGRGGGLPRARRQHSCVRGSDFPAARHGSANGRPSAQPNLAGSPHGGPALRARPDAGIDVGRGDERRVREGTPLLYCCRSKDDDEGERRHSKPPNRLKPSRSQ